jgi:hypothetical protein
MGETLKITLTESIEILSSDQEALLLEATYLPGKPPPKHLHPEQDEHFARSTGSKSTCDAGLEACSADALAIIESCSAR